MDDLVSIGYRKGDYVITFFREHNGNFNTALQLANSDKVYYRKSRQAINYTMKIEHLGLRQSNLSDFLNYIRMLNQGL